MENKIAKLACKFKICDCSAQANGSATEFEGNTATILAAVEMRERLTDEEEKEIVALYTQRAEVERKFADRLRLLSDKVWAPLLQ